MRIAGLLLLLFAAPASAQDDHEVSEDELIRWASNEVRILERREHENRVPMPPESYLGASGENAVVPALADDTALRILAELGGGTLGLAIGGGLGTLIVWGAMEANADGPAMTIAGAGGAVLGALGVTSGVVLAADATHGRGNFGGAFLGQAAGSVLAIPLVVVGLEENAPELAVIAAIVLPLAGAMFGYEIVHVESSASAPQQIAFVSPTSHGVIGGVAGVIW